MWVRKRLDIGWRDLLWAFGYAVAPGRGGRARGELERAWFSGEAGAHDRSGCPGVVTLSVRTAWDLWLQAMAFPPGSELVVSSVTIPEMAQIAQLNGLVVVPVAVDSATLAPDPRAVEEAITERTAAVLVAHLFGSRVDLVPVAEIARRHGLWLVEDCAQAYVGPGWTGSAVADVSLFSFGPIKTQTALGGALVRLSDESVRQRMLALAGVYALQSRFSYAARLLKYGCFKFLTMRRPYRFVAWLCKRRGRDLDVVVRQSVRNFSRDELLTAIRRRPSAPLVRLLARRVRGFRLAALKRRALRGEVLRDRLGGMAELPGEAARENTCWLFPMLCQHPAAIIDSLRANGFDASRNHSLTDLAAARGRAESNSHGSDTWLSQTVFLPCYPEIPAEEVERLAECLLSALPPPAPAPTYRQTFTKHKEVSPCA